MNRTNGKIAEQSRQKMTAALLTIMEQYDYREITVTQIVQEAGLSRNTFYRLFGDKENVLSFLFDGLFQAFFTRIQAEKTTSFWHVMQIYFDFWEERKPLLLLLQKNHLLQRVFDRSYSQSAQVFQLVHAEDAANSPGLPLPYLLAFSVGGMHSMLIKWAESGMAVPSRELIQKLRSCLMYDGLAG